jgi:hypothetical protein
LILLGHAPSLDRRQWSCGCLAMPTRASAGAWPQWPCGPRPQELEPSSPWFWVHCRRSKRQLLECCSCECPPVRSSTALLPQPTAPNGAPLGQQRHSRRRDSREDQCSVWNGSRMEVTRTVCFAPVMVIAARASGTKKQPAVQPCSLNEIPASAEDRRRGRLRG